MFSKFYILRTLLEQEISSQRELSKHTNFSLGKVNSLLNDCINQGYVNNFKITKEGLRFLKEYEVDNAIIMAAGFGSRFVPYTYETPKGLMEVHGERMVERLIKQLQEVGIKEIYVVVGYLKEKFEYLVTKYGVKLIHNPDYNRYNNISTIYHAQDVMKNTLIMPSDIYIMENMFHKYEFKSWYATTFFEGETDEWTAKTAPSGLITEMEIGGKDVLGLYGPTFFDAETSQKIIKAVNQDIKIAGKEQYYWENCWLDRINQIQIYSNEVEPESIFEFESIEELRVFDTTYITETKNEMISIICNVFGVTSNEITGIESMKKGMTNDSFIFRVNNKSYVFRAPGKGTEQLINRREEAKVYQAINHLKLSDKLYYINPENGYKISRYYDNCESITQDDIPQAFSILRMLHSSDISVSHSFNLEERIAYYMTLCKDSNAILFDDINEVSRLVDEEISYLNTLERPKVLCHIDPVESNFVKLYDGSLRLLDWEYAAMGDPILDIAMHAIYSGHQDDQILKLLEIYLERKPTKLESKILFMYVSLSGYLWALWTQFKQASGESFGSYALDQYHYAHKYARLALSMED